LFQWRIIVVERLFALKLFCGIRLAAPADVLRRSAIVVEPIDIALDLSIVCNTVVTIVLL
jgi:hypothetical protein